MHEMSYLPCDNTRYHTLKKIRFSLRKLKKIASEISARAYLKFLDLP
jgi:hypothetical protein